MNGEQLYFTISQMNLKDKKVYLGTLTEAQKLLYKRHSNKLRQQKFNEKPQNKEALNKHRKEYIAKQRAQKPEEFQKQNIKDVRAFREREKSKLEEIHAKVKASTINKDVKDILYYIIDTIPKQAELKKKREYMRNYRAEQNAKAKK